MNSKKPSNQNRDPNQKDWHEKRIEEGRAEQEKADAAKKQERGQPQPPKDGDQRLGRKPDESNQSGQERAEQRITRPGETGLANENRPGLGTRGDPTANQQDKQGQGGAAQQSAKAGAKGAKKGSPSVDPAAGKKPRPAPQEQNSNSLEQEEQRSTGMSGQSSGV